jgi:hypothetical protein
MPLRIVRLLTESNAAVDQGCHSRQHLRPRRPDRSRIDQTCLASSGGFAPISFPLFQGVRFGGSRIRFSFCMAILLGCRGRGMMRWRARHWSRGRRTRQWARWLAGQCGSQRGARRAGLPGTGIYGSLWENNRHRLGLGTRRVRRL